MLSSKRSFNGLNSFARFYFMIRARIRELPSVMIAGGVILTLYVIIAITGPLWAPYGPYQTGDLPFRSPTAEHWLGTDKVGRDMFSRIVHGAREVIFLSVTSTFIAMIIGAATGLLSALIGGWFDEIIMRAFEVLISIPTLILALLVITAAGEEYVGSKLLLIGVIAVVYAPRIARMARAEALNIVTQDFVTVSRTRGETFLYIIRHDLAPNAAGVLLVEFGVRAGAAPLLIGGLGFLGLGAQPPTPEWGLMISENRMAIVSSPIVVLAPTLALALLVIGINLFTDGLARVLGRTARRAP